MALDNFCEGTRVEEIELVLDLGLKQNVLEKLALWVLGRFFPLFNVMAVDCALGLRFQSALLY